MVCSNIVQSRVTAKDRVLLCDESWEIVVLQTCLAAKSSSGISSKVMAGLQPNVPISGQLLTLPSSVLTRVNASKPLALRVNNQRLTIPPNCFISTAEGIKVFLPTGTLPTGAWQKPSDVQINGHHSEDDRGLRVKIEESQVLNTNSYEMLLPKDSTCYFEKLEVGTDILRKIFLFLPHCDLLR